MSRPSLSSAGSSLPLTQVRHKHGPDNAAPSWLLTCLVKQSKVACLSALQDGTAIGKRTDHHFSAEGVRGWCPNRKQASASSSSVLCLHTSQMSWRALKGSQFSLDLGPWSLLEPLHLFAGASWTAVLCIDNTSGKAVYQAASASARPRQSPVPCELKSGPMLENLQSIACRQVLRP